MTLRDCAPQDAAVTLQRLDDDADPCGLFTLEDRSVAAVLLPSAERLPQIRKLAEDKRITTLLIVNAQWDPPGATLISDFGIGPWKVFPPAKQSGVSLSGSISGFSAFLLQPSLALL